MSKMAKLTVKEALEKTSGGRFNKKAFNEVLKAMANDTDFVAKVASVKKGELEGVEDVLVTKGFRKWIQGIVEKAGIDKAESALVLEDSFTIDNVDGLYEFFAEAVYEYISAGNQFNLLPKEDFKGSIYLKDVVASTRKMKCRNPKTGEDLGEVEIEYATHKELGVSSGCPEYLKTRKKA